MQHSFKQKQKRNNRYINELKSKFTDAEYAIKEKLDRLDADYVREKGFIKGDNHVIVDFYLPHPFKLCIEVDGGYHEQEEQKKRDEAKDQYLSDRGFNVIRLPNEKAESISLQKLKSLINDNMVHRNSPNKL